MKRSWAFLRLMRANRKARYWKKYALSLERQLEGERWRNQSREDELLTVPMRYLGMFGVATREAPAQPREPLRRQAQRTRTVPTSDPWSTLTDEERAEWKMWREDVNPTPEQEAGAKREFMEMVRLRRMGNEEIM